MPGLKKAGRIANDRIQLHLSKFGYFPVVCTSSLCKHATKNIIFSLVVENFGIKYVGKNNADHLIQEFKNIYTVSIDWDGDFILQPLH